MGKRKSEAIERFYSQTIISNNCWEWTGHIMNAGYGALSTNSGTQLVHRYAYKQFIGEIPDKMTIDHLCKNKLCVNPDHLEIVTRTENIRRCGLVGVAKVEASKKYCNKGHSYKLYGVRYKNGYTDYGTRKFARRCTKCHPRYLRYEPN